MIARRRLNVYDLAVVLPSWRGSSPPPPFWQRILSELDSLGIHADVIPAAVHTLRRHAQPPPGRRALLPSVVLVKALARSRAATFLCVEYNVATALCLLFSRVLGRRTIIFQEHVGREGMPLPNWERRYRRMLAALADAFIANTDSAYAEIATTLGVDRRRLFRATLLVPPDRKDLGTKLQAAPQPTRRPVFLFVGGLVKRKNVGGLLRAAASVRARGLDFEVWIAGDGPERPVLEAQASKLVSSGVVRFVGTWANCAIGALYDAADIFVMPSFRDYRSVAVLEALRFGKPVILSVQDGNAGDSVRDRETGLIFDPYQLDALADAMGTLIVEPDLVTEMGKRASDQMESETPRAAAARLRDILAQVGRS